MAIQYHTGEDSMKPDVFIYDIGKAKIPKLSALKHIASISDLEKSILSDAIRFE